MYGNIAFILMIVLYGVICLGVAVLAWSRGYNTAKKELQVRKPRCKQCANLALASFRRDTIA